MRRSTLNRAGALFGLMTICGGSTLFTSCHSIWRDAIFQGTEQFVLSLLDPTLVLDMFGDEGATDGSP
jgi:hypothetical protein